MLCVLYASHLLLIALSITLTAYLPPYATAVDLFLFLLVILPLIAYGLIASRQHVGERRARNALLEYAQRQVKREDLSPQATRTAARDRVHSGPHVGVEMGDLRAHRDSAAAAAACEADPQLQINPAAEGGLIGEAHTDSAQQ